MAANRTGTGKTEPESTKPNRLRFTTKLEKPETGETETAVLNRFPKISNGHNWGAIWSYRGLSTTTGTARASSCPREGSQGAWD